MRQGLFSHRHSPVGSRERAPGSDGSPSLASRSEVADKDFLHLSVLLLSAPASSDYSPQPWDAA